MNRKQFLLLLMLAALIGSAGLFIHHRDHGSWENTESTIGGKLLPGLAINDIAQIHIQSGTNELHLVRRDNLWRVQERGDYPANFSRISDLLLKLADLKIIQNEEVGPSQLGRFELLPPGSGTDSGTLVEFKDLSGKTLNSILLGKQHMKAPAANAGADGSGGGGWPDGRYVTVGAGAKTVAVISDPLESARPQADQWLNKDFFTIGKPRAISTQFAAATNSWKLTRVSETNDWQLSDARPDEKLDATKISSVTTPFSSVSFNDVAPLKANAGLAGSPGDTILSVDTFDGFTYLARIGSKQDDNYPVNFSVTTNLAAKGITPDQLAKAKQYEPWVYYLPAYSVDEFLKPRDQLLVQATNSVSPPTEK